MDQMDGSTAVYIPPKRRPMSAPRRSSRPISARTSLFPLCSKYDEMTEQLFLKSRELNKTHLDLVKYSRPPRAYRPPPPLKDVDNLQPVPIIQTTIVLKEQATSPLNDFHESYILPEHIRASVAKPIIHNIDIEAFEPRISSPGRKKPETSHRVIFSIRSGEHERGGLSTTPDKLTELNSHVLQEYQGLFIGLKNCSESIFSSLQVKKRNPLSNKSLQRMSGSDAENALKQGKSKKMMKPAEFSKSSCGRTHRLRLQKFTKRELSESFTRKSVNVFDPYEIYNVANGTIHV